MEEHVSVAEALVPITAIVMGIGIAMLGLWLDFRKKRDFYALFHQERLAAIEKGMEPPALPPDFFYRGGRNAPDFLRRGLVFLFLGAALTAAMLLENHSGAWFGLIPAAIGLANLILYAVQVRQPPAPPPR